MAQKAKISLLVVVGIIIAIVSYTGFILRSQGNANHYWKEKDPKHVSFDQYGVPTIKGANWSELMRRQGHVVASERLWQMDLIRRKASGRLAEWFGTIAYNQDVGTQLENRLEIAAAAAELLPSEERKTCDEYARGVNDFISENPGSWGIEYKIIGFKPEPWSCSDSILALMEMADLLTASAETEARSEPWRRNLSKNWDDFLFSLNHPWNKPLFGESDVAHAPIPPENEFLPMAAINPEKHASLKIGEPPIVGSNNWAWAGTSGKFVANDPHLGQSVPQIWYASRLVASSDNWIAGVSVPGIPGVIIGMNGKIAWAFTNTGEDVDDFLEEKLSEDGSKYLAKIEKGVEIWQDVIKKTFEIKVKDEAQPRVVEGLFTHRGPLNTRKHIGTGMYSRQWLALKPEVLRLPLEQIFNANDLDSFALAIGNMKIPSQNVVAMDRSGVIRYQTSGTGVERRVSGRRPANALEGEWVKFKSYMSRPNLTLKSDGVQPVMIATANERIWVDSFGHNWYNDDRKERIMSALTENNQQTLETMQALQLDTKSRYRKLLIDWIVERADSQPELAKKVPERWRKWDGSSTGDVITFADAAAAEQEMSKIFLARVAEAFPNESDKNEEYYATMRRSWLLTVLIQPGSEGTSIFGVNDIDLAGYLLEFLSSQKNEGYQTKNRWAAQHPFVAAIPFVGKLFSVSELEQWGAGDVVLAEKPTFGPSMRMVWDLDHPEQSTWVFPVGQSGHVWSNHYRGFRKLWTRKGVAKVFPEDEKAVFGF